MSRSGTGSASCSSDWRTDGNLILHPEIRVLFLTPHATCEGESYIGQNELQLETGVLSHDGRADGLARLTKIAPRQIRQGRRIRSRGFL